MNRQTIWSLALAVLAEACCLHRIRLEQFEKSSLQSQIKQYEQAISERCVYSEKLSLLDAISTHGYDTAGAMTKLLEHPDPNFPVADWSSPEKLDHSKRENSHNLIVRGRRIFRDEEVAIHRTADRHGPAAG